MIRTPDEWASYIREAHGLAVDAVIETGRRMQEAHDAYRAEPQRWGRRWRDWCRREFNWGDDYVTYLETVTENFLSVTQDIRQKLPASAYALYQLALLREDSEDAFNAALAAGRVSPATTQAQAKEIRADLARARRWEQDQALAETERQLRTSGTKWQIDKADLRHWNPPGPAKLILTDPPYDARSIDLYRALPACADQWLGEEGWCAVMTGHRHLPAILQVLASGPLEYVWMFALASPSGRANGIQFIHVQNTWKPVILLRKGKQPLYQWTGDLISYEWEKSSRVVQLHKWQQDVSPFEKIIRAMTLPDDLVVDPFCGAGTTGIAALSSGRRFAGCDVELQTVDTASQRLRQFRESLLQSDEATA